MERVTKAETLFKEGCNCSQAVVGAFSDLLPFDEDTILKLASPFGGGMGRLREVCGAVSGMFIVLGFLEGYDNSSEAEKKQELYEKVQLLAKKFENSNGSIVCRELLGLSVKNDSPTPEKRTEEYYKKRPCVELVKEAVKILQEYLENTK